MDKGLEPQNPFASPLAEELRSVSATDSESRAASTRRQYIDQESLARSIGYLFYVASTYAVLVAILAVAVFIFEKQDRGIAAVMLGSAACCTLTFWWVGRGLLRLNRKARIIATIICTLAIPATLLGSVYFLWLLYGGDRSYLYSAEYREVCSSTPHIEPRTPLVMWILIVVCATALPVLFLLDALLS